MGALRRAESMAMALEVRGFSSPRTRTAYPRAGWALRDAVAAAALVAITVLYLWLWIGGYAKVAA
jgi:energy-coupling factor transporter transmembrane protein EcfT